MPHNLDQIPAGFRPVLWSEVTENETVYLQGVRGGVPHAYGPHRVSSPSRRILESMVKVESFTHLDETLLVKKGPLVVVTVNDGTVTGLYADVPLELAVTSHDMTVPRKGCEIKRPWSFDDIPQEHQDILDAELPPGWPGFYGQWSIEENSRDERTAPEASHDFTLESRMAAGALAVELLRTAKPFSVTPDGDKFVFTVTTRVLEYIQVHLEEMVGGLGHVTR